MSPKFLTKRPNTEHGTLNTTMLTATYIQGQGLAFVERSNPEIKPDEALVKVDATAICGTDVKIARNGSRKAKAGQSWTLGHEFVGTVVEVGSSARGLSVGTRVGVAPNFGCGRCEACIRGLANMCGGYSAFGIDTDGSHAPYVRLPAATIAQGNVVELPAGVAPEAAALAEPLSCVLNAQHSVRLRAGESVMVYGVGPMGLLHVILAAASGAAPIIVVDTNAQRLAKARELGADLAIDGSAGTAAEPVSSATRGRGVDVVFTAASVPQIVPEALKLLAPFGRLCLFAGLLNGQSSVPLDANLIHYRNLVVTGTSGGCNADYRTVLSLMESRRVDVQPVISHVFPMSRLADAYETALSGQGMKIVIKGE